MKFLNKMNPWWFYSSWEDKDEDLSKWESQKYKWYPSWISFISLKPYSLNFVYGPRQVGKTTGLKILIKSLLQQGVNPESVVYFDLDIVASLQEFRRILEGIISRKRGRSETFYVFLDEVTSVKDWCRVLKFFIDHGEFKNDVIVVTGSSSIGITKAPERFPGRKGFGKEVLVLPLSFQEFIKVKGYKREDVLYDEFLAQKLFTEYKEKGGFPKSINDNPDANKSLIDGIISEIYKHSRDLRIIQDIISSLMEKIPSALSYNSIANDIGVSHNTVSEYLDFLSDLFLIGIAYWYSEGKVDKKKEKKVFFRDPFILHSLSLWVNKKFDESALLENIVQEHLFRKFGEVYYFKNNSEIDVIAGEYKIEIKKSRSRRGYPKGVRIISEEEIPRLLLEIEK
ncbi:ATP-binding protein [Sulfurisphaera javensis]|uniref:ATP-binding protein n=1 Tax=Sulfurisphaera javensis TaxID=2049879 RepID=A0AAT9GMY3_9CREN